MDLWIAGQWISGEFPNVIWELSGVFDTEEKAVAACRNWTYFVAPMKLNKQLPHETVDVGGYYPIKREG